MTEYEKLILKYKILKYKKLLKNTWQINKSMV